MPALSAMIAGAAWVWLGTSRQAAFGSGPLLPPAGGEGENHAAIVSAASPTPLPAPKTSRALEVSPTIEESVSDLRARHLLIPIEGVESSALRDSFGDARDRTRQHEALDILAPRNTPVRAVEGGTIAKLFLSKPGGITIYQFDPTQHVRVLLRAPGAVRRGPREDAAVSAGQVIGYVGTSGNAPPDAAPAFRDLQAHRRKHWWQGTAINPFDVWR